MPDREAAGWGLVGALAFLVLALGYRLGTDAEIGFPVLLGVAIVVGLVSAVASARLRRRIGRGQGNESP